MVKNEQIFKEFGIFEPRNCGPHFLSNCWIRMYQINADQQPTTQEKKNFLLTYLVKEDIFSIDSFGGVLL
jgi:hypothetical protein